MSQFKTLRALARRWRRAPLLPMLVVVVLTVGTASSTAVLGVAWAALLRPLPYPAPEQLVRVHSTFPLMKLAAMGLSSQEAFELGQLTTAFSGSGFGYVSSVTVSTGARATQARIANVTVTTLTTLGVVPVAGRMLAASDDTLSATSVVMIGEGFWARQFGADPRAIGRTILIDGRQTSIAGVLPASADFAGTAVDLWLPLRFEYRPDDPEAKRSRSNHAFTVIARVKTGVTLDEARADVDRAVSTWSDTVAQPHSPSPSFHPLGLTPLDDVVRGNVRVATLVLLSAVALVLVIAGANASTLLLAQAEARRAEMAVRAALGAGRAALWRLHATEASLLAAIAAVLSLALSFGLTKMLARLAPDELARKIITVPMSQTAAIAIAIAFVTAAIASCAPLGRLRLVRLGAALAAESRSGTASPDRQRLRRVLVGVQIAIAVTLFAGAALLIESFWRLTSVDPGFKPDGIVRTRVYLPSARYAERGSIDGAYDAILARLRAQPGVTGAGLMSGMLPERFPNNTSLQPDVAGLDLHTSVPPVQFLQFVDADALAVIGLPIVRGRGIAASDIEGGTPVALLNETAASTYFKGLDPIGRRIRGMGAGLPWLTVVGIVGDAHQAGLAREIGTEIFVPIVQAANLFGLIMTRDLNIVVRVRGASPLSIAGPLRSIVADVEQLAALSDIAVMRDVILDSVATPRFLTVVLAAFAVVALLLCAAGVYGVVMHAVAQRTREIGVRRSLGAPAAAIVALVAKQAGALVVLGLVAGLAGAIAATRALQSLAFQTPAVSVTRLVAVIVVLGATAACACALPLVRALRVDPATALRSS